MDFLYYLFNLILQFIKKIKIIIEITIEIIVANITAEIIREIVVGITLTVKEIVETKTLEK